MNYELAKKLKGEGFPHKYIIAELGSERTDSRYFPTLSELIEACGGGFAKVERIPWVDRGSRSWSASCSVMECEDIFAEGETPEEAVANLWLKLNKKWKL